MFGTCKFGSNGCGSELSGIYSQLIQAVIKTGQIGREILTVLSESFLSTPKFASLLEIRRCFEPVGRPWSYFQPVQSFSSNSRQPSGAFVQNGKMPEASYNQLGIEHHVIATICFRKIDRWKKPDVALNELIITRKIYSIIFVEFLPFLPESF